MRKILLVLFIFLMFQNTCEAIKIGLLTGVNSASLGSSATAMIISGETNTAIGTIDGMKAYEFRASGDSIEIYSKGRYVDLHNSLVTIKPNEDEFVCCKQKWYRGHLILKNINGKLYVINKVDLEDYLQGVVPAEMPSSWNYEALKAQAIAARSYALANLGKRGAYGYDLKDTPEDQAYNGASAETSATNKAVADSRSIVLIYNLKIIPAYYSASAGGHTLKSSDVWSSDLPYVRAVPSYDEGVKKNGHGVGMSQHGANNLAKKGYNAYQILQYFFQDIRFARIKESYYK